MDGLVVFVELFYRQDEMKTLKDLEELAARFEPGEIVTIKYTGYSIKAKVIEPNPMGMWGRELGWVKVEQITDFEDREKRPVFEAAAEFISKEGEPEAESPLAILWKSSVYKE